jgi:hypothetical protein
VQKSGKNSFGLLELEMADLERFWRKTPLGPLGVKLIHCCKKMFMNLGAYQHHFWTDFLKTM